MLIVEGLRPMIPPHCPDWLAKLMAACNANLPEARPSFAAVHAAMNDKSASDARGLNLCIEQLLQASEQMIVENTQASAPRASNFAPGPQNGTQWTAQA